MYLKYIYLTIDTINNSIWLKQERKNKQNVQKFSSVSIKLICYKNVNEFDIIKRMKIKIWYLPGDVLTATTTHKINNENLAKDIMLPSFWSLNKVLLNCLWMLFRWQFWFQPPFIVRGCIAWHGCGRGIPLSDDRTISVA